MLDRDQVRLAAALAHVIAGAELRLRCSAGDELVVSRHPAADLPPCAFRQLVASAAGDGSGRGVSPCPAIDQMGVGGAVGDLGGGVFRTCSPDGREERWLGSTLGWPTVRAMVERFAREHSISDELEATVAPDGVLGVTLVRLDATSNGAAMGIDRVAANMSAALLVEEMIHDLTAPLDVGRSDGDR